MKCIKIIKDKIKELDDDMKEKVYAVYDILKVIHGDENINYEYQINKLRELVLEANLSYVKDITFKSYESSYSFDIIVEFDYFKYTYSIVRGTNGERKDIYYFMSIYNHIKYCDCGKRDYLKNNLIKIIEAQFMDKIFELSRRKDIYITIDRRYDNNIKYDIWDYEPSNYCSSIYGEIDRNYILDYIDSISLLNKLIKSNLTVKDFSDKNLGYELGSVEWKEYKL